MPAATNFLQFNENLNNAESDSAYSADSLRVNGIPTDAIWPSLSANKTLFQLAQFVAAFCQMMVGKGYSPNDGGGTTAGFNALVAVLANVKTSADFSASMISVPYAGSIAFNAAESSGFDLTLTGNVVSSSLANTSVGQILSFVISQDATGGRKFSWPSTLPNTGPICPYPSSTSIQLFQVRYSGAIVPLAPMIWQTGSGIVMQPTGVVVGVSTSGVVSNGYAEITEEVNCSAGSVTRSLYSAIGTAGFKVNIKRAPGDTSTNALMVQPLISGQLIDGFPNWGPIPPYNSFTFQSDGANFILI